MAGQNNHIVITLREIARTYDMRRDRPRAIAYEMGAEAVERAVVKIRSGQHAQDLKLGRIGKSIAETIDEILRTGTSQRLLLSY